MPFLYRQYPFEIVDLDDDRFSRMHRVTTSTRDGERFKLLNRWCREKVGPIGWGYNADTYYFRDERIAFEFKMRWG